MPAMVEVAGGGGCHWAGRFPQTLSSLVFLLHSLSRVLVDTRSAWIRCSLVCVAFGRPAENALRCVAELVFCSTGSQPGPERHY